MSERRPPTTRLQALIRGWIDAIPHSDDLGRWPSQLGKEHDLLLIDGNGAFFWYLADDGRVYWLDSDDFAQRLEPETDWARAIQAIERAASVHPELRELLS